jgi:hypothetical protein
MYKTLCTKKMKRKKKKHTMEETIKSKKCVELVSEKPF